jgi:hypothetical protein
VPLGRPPAADRTRMGTGRPDSAAHRGFVWGDVFEWVAGSARPWPGYGASVPGSLDRLPPAGSQGVLRGASG